MKSIALLLLSLLAAPGARAADVTFDWDPYTDAAATEIIMFERISADSTKFVGKVAATVPSMTTLAWQAGEHTVFIVAVSADGLQSPPSNTVTFTVPLVPANLKRRISMEGSNNLDTWEELASRVEDATSRRFYRLVVTLE